MKKGKFTVLILVTAMVTAFLFGCSTKGKETISDKGSVTLENDTEPEETEGLDSETKEEKMTENVNTEGSGDNGQNTEEENTSVFTDASNYEFWFSSGAGGWGTTLTLMPDGTFWGEYYDSDMGDTGEDYPNGIQYRCDFYGKFTEPVQVNAYTYEFQIATIRYNREPGEEEIVGGRKYIYSEPYGLEEATKLHLYLPEASTEELPKEYLEWVNMGHADSAEDTLGYYGLYNVSMKEGFSSGKISKEAVALNRELAELEEQAQEMNDRLRSGALSQIEMNRLSGELFRLWDGELNSLWSRLKETLGSDEMESLTKEEREWIKWKDQSVKDAGKEAEGGSLQPLLENDTAAEHTRERVYNLAGWLKSEMRG